MKMLEQEARQLASAIRNPLAETLETVFMRTRQDVLEELAIADDEKQIRRLQGKARALKESAEVFQEAYRLSEANSKRAES